jgi:succinoglycan biosynthesis transport protein ExoP
MFDELDNAKARSFEEYWDIVKRRRWLILATVFVCWAVVWGCGWLIPPTYESEAEIIVEQQQVPKDYVTPNVSTTAEEQLQTMTQQILSRPRLQSIIDQYRLYSHQNRILAMFKSGDPVEQMRKDIKIDLVETQAPSPSQKQLTAFKITYGARTPEIANEIVGKLASFFINQNMITQQERSQGTTSFLSTQLADAKAILDKQEAQVQAFKARHLGELPDQLQSNVEILSGLQAQLQNAQGELDRSEQQKLYLESIVQQYQSAQSALNAGGDSAVSPPALDKELKDLRMQLEQKRAEYTDNYPDVIALKDQITKTEALKKQIDAEIAKNQKSQKSGDGMTPMTATELQNGQPTPMMQIESQLKSNQLQIQSEKKAQQALQARIAQYQTRLNMTPVTEQELAEVSRGYNEAKANYDSLLAKENESQLATNLEQNQQGEKFSLVDPASLPPLPSSPNHILISLGGLVFGVALALGLTILMEVTGARIRQEKDLEGLVPVRVLVGIPHISTPQEHQQRMARRWLERGVAIAIVLLIVAGNIYAFYRG